VVDTPARRTLIIKQSIEPTADFSGLEEKGVINVHPVHVVLLLKLLTIVSFFP